MNVVNLMNVTSRKYFNENKNLKLKKNYEHCDYCEYTECNSGTLAANKF